jgi:hypothetical protein
MNREFYLAKSKSSSDEVFGTNRRLLRAAGLTAILLTFASVGLKLLALVS